MPMDSLCQKRRHKGEMPFFFKLMRACVSDSEGQKGSTLLFRLLSDRHGPLIEFFHLVRCLGKGCIRAASQVLF